MCVGVCVCWRLNQQTEGFKCGPKIFHAGSKKKKKEKKRESRFHLVTLSLVQIIRQHCLGGINKAAWVKFYNFIYLSLAFGANMGPLFDCLVVGAGMAERHQGAADKEMWLWDSGHMTQQPRVALYVWSQLTPSYCLADIQPTQSSAGVSIGPGRSRWSKCSLS